MNKGVFMKTGLDEQDNEPRFIFNLSIEQHVPLQLHSNLIETYKDLLILEYYPKGNYLFSFKFDSLTTIFPSCAMIFSSQ